MSSLRPYGTGLLCINSPRAYGHLRHYRSAVCRGHGFIKSLAHQNPTAQYRERVTVDDVLASKPIADPLKLLDCSIVSDGGAAVVLTTLERARDLPHAPIVLKGYGEGHHYEHISQATDLTQSAAADSGKAAFEQAGISRLILTWHSSMTVFSPALLIQLEDLGFCEKGAGGAFLASGATQPGGKLPVNTHGGMLSHCHPEIRVPYLG